MKTIIKLLLLIVIGGVIVRGGSWLLSHRESIQTENRGVAALEKGKYQEAIDIFEKLLAGLSEQDSDRDRRLRHYLARSYKSMAEDPGRPLAESIALYRQAADYDESVIEDDLIRRLLKQQGVIPAWR